MAPSPRLDVHVTPGRILTARTPIVVVAPEPLDPSSARSAIRVRGRRGSVELDEERRRARWIPGEPLPPGRHVLTVGSMRTERGATLRGIGDVPFLVSDSAAPIPPDLRVEHMVRLRVHDLGTERVSIFERPRGEFIEILKAYDLATEEPRPLAYDQDGEEIGAVEVFARIRRNRRDRYGTLEPSLWKILQGPDVPDRLDIAVWLEWLPPTGDRPRGRVEPPDLEAWLAQARQGFLAAIDEFEIGRAEEVPGAPVVDLELPTRLVPDIAAAKGVRRVCLRGRSGKGDLQQSIDVARADHVHDRGFGGADVRVALWDLSPLSDDLLEIEGYYVSPPPAPPDDEKDHALLAIAVIKNREGEDDPRGHAPDCTLYSANARIDDALRWAVEEKVCTVVCQVFHSESVLVWNGLLPEFVAEGDVEFLTTHDHTKDWLVVAKDAGAIQASDLDAEDPERPVIVQAAGNGGADEYVNHKGFNGLVVGSHDDDGKVMVEDSARRNPDSMHGDREMPEIAANGTWVQSCGVQKGGTSFAAPVVAGAAALLQSVDAELKTSPEACRAILLAGARIFDGAAPWWEDVVGLAEDKPEDAGSTVSSEPKDRAQGAGRLDSYASLLIAESRCEPGVTTKESGWDAGVLEWSQFDSGIHPETHEVEVSSCRFGWCLWRYDVKVALAWNSEVDGAGVWLDPYDSQVTWDLDLRVLDEDGQLVSHSSSYDNTYEIAEFEAVRGTTYSIMIRRWTGDGVAGRDFARYGIAWSVRRRLRWSILDSIRAIARRIGDWWRGGPRGTAHDGASTSTDPSAV